MQIYHWFTVEQKDDYGRYIGNVLYGKGGIAPFYKCYDNYKPNRKGGHRHNHIYNACHRIVFRNKSARRHVSREEKKRFVATFWANMRLNPDELCKILAKRRKQ